MFNMLRGFILSIAMLMLSFPAYAEEVSKEQIKGLDEQVQEIKTDVLGIASQLSLLEEKLLYPSSTQVAVFVSSDDMTRFRLDSIEIRLDDKTVAQHLYTLRELGALQKGGMQRLYVGNISSGEHGLQVLVIGRGADSSGLRRTEKFKFRKDEGPKLLEVRLVDSGAHIITLRDW